MAMSNGCGARKCVCRPLPSRSSCRCCCTCWCWCGRRTSKTGRMIRQCRHHYRPICGLRRRLQRHHRHVRSPRRRLRPTLRPRFHPRKQPNRRQHRHQCRLLHQNRCRRPWLQYPRAQNHQWLLYRHRRQSLWRRRLRHLQKWISARRYERVSARAARYHRRNALLLKPSKPIAAL